MIKSTKIHREKVDWSLAQPIETKIELMTQYLNICMPVINSILEQEVCSMTSSRYTHQKPHNGDIAVMGSIQAFSLS